MVVAFPTALQNRLREIEEQEGMPSVDFVLQAVSVWSTLTADERRVLGVCAMKMVIRRYADGVDAGA